MLKYLFLKDFILIDRCEIPFQTGCNIITGETGAGKTIVLHALSIALGAKVDASMIRAGCSKATIECAFEIKNSKKIYPLLEEAGIEYEEEDALYIKREIHTNGRNRTWINSQMSAVPFVKKIAKYLIEFVSQGASYALKSQDMQRNILDQYGNLASEKNIVAELYDEKRALAEKLKELQHQTHNKEAQLAQLQWKKKELTEINLSINLKELEYQIQNQHEQLELLQGLTKTIECIDQNFLVSLPQLLREIKTLIEKIPSLHIDIKQVKQFLIFLQEASYALSSHKEKLTQSTTNFEEKEHLVSKIHHITKKFGCSFEEIPSLLQSVEAQIQNLNQIEDHILQLQEKLQEKEDEYHKKAQELSKKRKACAGLLAKQITKELQALNMPKAETHIELTPSFACSHGMDQVQFLISPNLGEKKTSTQGKVSGGELSRVLFALKLILQETIPTLIFDEIDANIGGTTATMMGEKLVQMSQERQIIAITHFPQVAQFASNHIQVTKKEKEGRTTVSFTSLNPKERKEELLRMLGGKHIEALKL